MKLKDWVNTRWKGTKEELAERLGIARNTLHLYIKGIRQPPLDVALRIEELTNGEVRVEDLVIPRKTPAGVK